MNKYSEESNELIQKCSFLFRRIEFEIDIKNTVEELLRLIRSDVICDEIIIEAMIRGVINKIYVLNFLSIMCF